MATYKYSARGLDGLTQHGEITAENPQQAKQELQGKGLLSIKVKAPLIDFSSLMEKPIPLNEMLIFNRQLQIIYSVGIPILSGMDTIYHHTQNPQLKEAVKDIKEKLAEGQDLSSSMKFHPKIFDITYVNLIRAGEISGQLEEILERISSIAEMKFNNESKIKAALFYPKIVVGFMVAIFIGVMAFIIPNMKKFYKQLGIELPGITQFFIGVSDFMASWGFVAVVFVLIGLGVYLKKNITEAMVEKIDYYLLKFPQIGNLIVEVDMNSFCTILELMLKSGVSLMESLRVVSATMSSRTIAKEVKNFENAIVEGQTLAFAVHESEHFPLLVKNFVAIGEKAGSIEKVLARISLYYKDQVDERISKLSKIIEPILMLMIFGSVLALALTVFLPMWKMNAPK